MMERKRLVLVILGPTSSGKSDLAVKLALLFDGEIISADSRQVYKGLDIGSGKVTKEETRGVPHHLLDVADPREQFSVSQYQKLAREKIEEIISRGKLPIICGGTGLYIKSVVDNLDLPEVPPNPELRKELEGKSTEELFARISALDPESAQKIDRYNPRRLVRAIEIAIALDKIPPLGHSVAKWEFLQIGLNPPAEILREKIRIRLFARIREGMIEEVENLHGSGVSWERLDELGLEYRYVSRYLRKMLTKEEMERELELAIWHYAKRQMTWFKRDSRINWVADFEEARTLVSEEARLKALK